MSEEPCDHSDSAKPLVNRLSWHNSFAETSKHVALNAGKVWLRHPEWVGQN